MVEFFVFFICMNSFLISPLSITCMGFSGGSVVKNLPAKSGDAEVVDMNPWVRKSPWSRKRQPTLVFLPSRKFQGQRRLVGCMQSMRSERVSHD